MFAVKGLGVNLQSEKEKKKDSTMISKLAKVLGNRLIVRAGLNLCFLVDT